MNAHRRKLISTFYMSLAAIASSRMLAAQTTDLDLIRQRWRTFAPRDRDFPLPSERLERTESEWRSRLDSLAFDVLREMGTEPAGSSPLNDEHRAGLYVCAGCDLPLFSSEMKFDSGTGWPSFFTTIADVFATQRDYFLLFPRTEYHCVRCGGHHGHVFDDGPPPTGERWCNNGIALKFIPRAG
jgi:peptide-methionine (R)-S-oxide reductase